MTADAPLSISLDFKPYVRRSVTLGDASEHWGRWTLDANASIMLNAPPKAMTKIEIEAYIRSFDQRSRLLLGTFEQTTGRHLGITRVDLRSRGRFLVSMLIGEADYRRKGIATTGTRPFREYFFETLGLQTMLATVLSHNRPMIHYLYRTGCILDKTFADYVRSHADGSMLDLCCFSQSREAWLAWKKANPLFGLTVKAGDAGRLSDAAASRTGNSG